MELDWVGILLRWLHVTAAICAAGGAIFARLVALPALGTLPTESRSALHEEMRRRFMKLVMASIAVLLLTGFFNYLVYQVPVHKGQPLYHGLMGLKILLAFAVFFLASALTGRSPAMQWIRDRRSFYLGWNVVLALAVVLLGAVLRSIPHSLK